MAVVNHLIEVRDPQAGSDFLDRVIVGQKLGVANAAGGGAGANVATVVTFTEPLPTNYTVVVQPGQSATWWISNKISFGFTVNLTPNPSSATLAAGSFDVTVLAF
jgi:hypothetical protein